MIQLTILSPEIAPPEKSTLPGTVEDGSDNIETDSDAIGSSNTSSAVTREKALAFTVPGDDDPSLIRKHPPLRFRKLEDQQVEISQEMINMKQAEAEKRRSAVSHSK